MTTVSRSTTPKTPLPEDLEETLGNRSEFHNALFEGGWEKLGAGVYATVYGHHDYPFVIKVGKCGSVKHDGWLHFARWAKRAKANPRCTYRDLLPTIGTVREMGDWYVAVIERLEPPRKNIFHSGAYERAVEYIQRFSAFRHSYRPVARRANKAWLEITLGKAWPRMLRRIEKVAEGRADLDLHGGNFMCRDMTNVLGTLVVTDPLV